MSALDWGDSVRVIPSAPKEYFPGAVGSVVGFRPRDVDGVADEGETLVLVEFADGNALEVPSRYLVCLRVGSDS
jgi:hypothetical protein